MVSQRKMLYFIVFFLFTSELTDKTTVSGGDLLYKPDTGTALI